MSECNKCNKEVSMPYECNLCGKQFCSDHRLPEKHSCPMLDRGGTDANVVVEVENQRSENKSGLSSKIPSASGLSNITSGITNGIIDGKVNRVFGLTIVTVYILQLLTIAIAGEEIHSTLFVLQPNNITHVWTWFTSIFAHSPFMLFHIIGNGIILVFFGGLVEKLIGSRDYAILFISAGVIAALGQALLGLALGNPSVGILGASGALLAVLGVLTSYKPDLTVHLYFFIPVPLWLITGGYATLSIVGILGGGGTGGIAHGAHLIGLLIGLMYGYRTKSEKSVADSTRIGGQI